MEAVSILRERINACHSPLLRLPSEILQLILAEVPELVSGNHDFNPFWLSTAVDTTMLIPVLHTSRRLRALALSHKPLWRTIITSPRLRPIIPLVRLAHGPLVMVMPLPSRSSTIPDTGLLPVLADRVEELHVTNIEIHHMDELRPMLALDYPVIFTLSLSGAGGWYACHQMGALPLSTATATSLQSLALMDIPLLPTDLLPTLTHLALYRVVSREDNYEPVAGVLQRCPNLQSLVLDGMGRSRVDRSNTLRDVGLKCLRRVTLAGDSCTKWLSLIPYRDDGPSIQVPHLTLGYLDHDDRQFWPFHFCRYLMDAEMVCIRAHRDTSNSDRRISRISITAVSHQKVAHTVFNPWAARCSPPHEVEESFNLLFTGISPARELWLWCDTWEIRKYCSATQVAISRFICLESITLIYTDTLFCRPGLSNCPQLNSPLPRRRRFVSPRLKTLVIVWHVDPATSYGKEMQMMRCQDMIEQLDTGDYTYFKHLVIRITPGCLPNRWEQDLEKLRTHFETVQVEDLIAPPELPLPESSVETRSGTCGSQTLWKGTLW